MPSRPVSAGFGIYVFVKQHPPAINVAKSTSGSNAHKLNDGNTARKLWQARRTFYARQPEFILISIALLDFDG